MELKSLKPEFRVARKAKKNGEKNPRKEEGAHRALQFLPHFSAAEKCKTTNCGSGKMRLG